MISRNTLACCRIAGPIRVTTANEFQLTCLNHFAQFKTKTSVLRAFEISYQLFHENTKNEIMKKEEKTKKKRKNEKMENMKK